MDAGRPLTGPRGARAADALLHGLVAVGVAGTAWALLDDLGWVFALATHFHPQLLAVGLATAALALWRRRPRPGALAVAVAAVNALGLAPAWGLARGGADAADAAPLTVLYLNVEMTNGDHAALAALVAREDPDVVALVEVDDAWVRALDAPLAAWPFRALAPREDFLGLALYSRHPLGPPALRRASPGGLPWLAVPVRAGGTTWTVAVLHTLPPVGARWVEASEALLDDVAARGDALARPVVLCGDFNLTPWSPAFRRFAERSGLRLAGPDAPTWPGALAPVGLPIDHCLVSPDVAVRSAEVGPDVGSDHRPVALTVAAPAAAPTRPGSPSR